MGACAYAVHAEDVWYMGQNLITPKIDCGIVLTVIDVAFGVIQ